MILVLGVKKEAFNRLKAGDTTITIANSQHQTFLKLFESDSKFAIKAQGVTETTLLICSIVSIWTASTVTMIRLKIHSELPGLNNPQKAPPDLYYKQHQAQ